MQAAQRQHIDTVMQVANHGIDAMGALRHERVIRDSWLRCVQQHRLDPTRMQEAVILPATRLREHQDQMEAFTHIARHGLETLYQQVAGLGYVVLLTDARGVTVDFIGDLQIDASLRKAGLYLGADWSEQHAGTCGVGTAISTGEALTVHLDDHFDATHIPLTCTTSPVYDDAGRLTAVLDISALSSPRNKDSQALALQLVKLYARQIEDAAFLHRHRSDWVLRLAAAPQFLDVRPQYLLALDAGGRVTGHNRAAQLAFGGPQRVLLGARLDSLFELHTDDLGRFAASQPGDRRAVLRQGGKELLFLQATPPPRAPAPRQAPQAPAVPEPLAALSAGDPALDRQIERAARLVNSPISLLITGETGSGKEYFAKALHAASARRARPFVAVNCAAIPEALIESELFGHVAGSFSGAAAKGKKGLITEADGGTLFLDEIGDMPLALQARLLRVLSEREVLPVGATRPQPVNIRVIAATHAPLESLVRQGRFRDDLYYRINGAQILLPPLRVRSDLGVMIERLAGGLELEPAARRALLAWHWPGNLRELRNVLDCAASLCSGRCIALHDLPPQFSGLGEGPGAATAHAGNPAPHAGGAAALAGSPQPAAGWALPAGAGQPAPHPAPAAGAEAALLAALKAAHWNVSAVARQLGVARMTVYRRMQRAGIVAPQHLG